MIGFNITAVERETGLSREVLRIWEKRYGFPSPSRDANGERRYPVEQVERLQLIKRLLDQGHRPGKLVHASADELANLTPRRSPPIIGKASVAEDLQVLMGLITDNNVAGFQKAMQHRLVRDGLQRFVLDTVAPLSQAVGEAWEKGLFQVFEEHLFSEQTMRILRRAISALPDKVHARPRVILTTPPEELHAIGLMMVEALFELEDAYCIPLGTQTPLIEIQKAAEGHRADVVALSISAAYPARQVGPLLQQLRLLLPASVELWAGGAGTKNALAPAGVTIMPSLEDAVATLRDWIVLAKH